MLGRGSTGGARVWASRVGVRVSLSSALATRVGPLLVSSRRVCALATTPCPLNSSAFGSVLHLERLCVY